MARTSLIVGVLGLLIAAVSFYWSTIDRSPEAKIASCRDKHSAPVAPPTLPDNPTGAELDALSVKLWADCSWPALPGAGVDGYWEVTAHRFTSGESNADMENADVLTTKCDNVVLRYSHTQGVAVVWDYTFATDQVLSLQGSTDKPKPSVVALSAEMEKLTGGRRQGQLVVLTPANVGLSKATCSASS